jgi:hypothetical protein
MQEVAASSSPAEGAAFPSDVCSVVPPVSAKAKRQSKRKKKKNEHDDDDALLNEAIAESQSQLDVIIGKMNTAIQNTTCPDGHPLVVQVGGQDMQCGMCMRGVDAMACVRCSVDECHFICCMARRCTPPDMHGWDG